MAPDITATHTLPLLSRPSSTPLPSHSPHSSNKYNNLAPPAHPLRPLFLRTQIIFTPSSIPIPYLPPPTSPTHPTPNPSTSLGIHCLLLSAPIVLVGLVGELICLLAWIQSFRLYCESQFYCFIRLINTPFFLEEGISGGFFGFGRFGGWWVGGLIVGG